MPDRRHRAFLGFVSKATEISSRHSKEDFYEFMDAARGGYPQLIPLIREYLHIAEMGDTNVEWRSLRTRQFSAQEDVRRSDLPPHLFDLLRSKKLFPTNAILSEFASRVLHGIESHRFGKMSRADIAARIVEFIESRDTATRRSLEESMRDALSQSASERKQKQRSFFKTWENIIKGM